MSSVDMTICNSFCKNKIFIMSCNKLNVLTFSSLMKLFMTDSFISFLTFVRSNAGSLKVEFMKFSTNIQHNCSHNATKCCERDERNEQTTLQSMTKVTNAPSCYSLWIMNSLQTASAAERKVFIKEILKLWDFMECH